MRGSCRRQLLVKGVVRDNLLVAHHRTWSDPDGGYAEFSYTAKGGGVPQIEVSWYDTDEMPSGGTTAARYDSEKGGWKVLNKNPFAEDKEGRPKPTDVSS